MIVLLTAFWCIIEGTNDQGISWPCFCVPTQVMCPGPIFIKKLKQQKFESANENIGYIGKSQLHWVLHNTGPAYVQQTSALTCNGPTTRNRYISYKCIVPQNFNLHHILYCPFVREIRFITKRNYAFLC